MCGTCCKHNTTAKTVPQSVIFDNRYFTVTSARKWLKSHGFESKGKVHKTAKTLRFRLVNPSQFSKFRTKALSPAIRLVLGIK